MLLGTLHGVGRQAGRRAVVRWAGGRCRQSGHGELRAWASDVEQQQLLVQIERFAHLDTALLAAPLTIPTALPMKLLTAQRVRGAQQERQRVR